MTPSTQAQIAQQIHKDSSLFQSTQRPFDGLLFISFFMNDLIVVSVQCPMIIQPSAQLSAIGTAIEECVYDFIDNVLKVQLPNMPIHKWSASCVISFLAICFMGV